MKLYKIERKDRGGYDTFDMAVVAAESEDQARYISPNGWQVWVNDKGWVRKSTGQSDYLGSDWTSPANVEVTEIGTAKAGTENGVIVASFNAG